MRSTEYRDQANTNDLKDLEALFSPLNFHDLFICVRQNGEAEKQGCLEVQVCEVPVQVDPDVDDEAEAQDGVFGVKTEAGRHVDEDVDVDWVA